MTRTKKIFVGGLSVNTTVEDVKHYFDQFGKVNSTQISQELLLFPKDSIKCEELMINLKEISNNCHALALVC